MISGSEINKKKLYATMDWHGEVVSCTEDGKILPRLWDLKVNPHLYPNGINTQWPIDPETGEKLPVWMPKQPKKKNAWRWLKSVLCLKWKWLQFWGT